MSSFHSESSDLSLSSSYRSQGPASVKSRRIGKIQRPFRCRNLVLISFTIFIAYIFSSGLYSNFRNRALQEWLQRGQSTYSSSVSSQNNGESIENEKSLLSSDFQPELDERLKFVKGFVADLGKSTGTTKFSSSSSSCPDGCLTHGTCNEELGQCRCPRGFMGPTCSELAMPGCNLAPGYSQPSCHFPTSCRCMIDCDRYRMPHNSQCFDDIRNDGTVENDISLLFKSALVSLKIDGQGNGVGKKEVLPDDIKKQYLYQNPLNCPNNCSGIGACYADGKKGCNCPWGYEGLSCETISSMPFNCPNNCSRRGICIDHFCKCERGFFGADCAVYLDENGKSKLVPRSPFLWTNSLPAVDPREPESPKIYVYDLPGEFNMWQMGKVFWNMDWPEEVLFFERLLTSPHRTANGDEADFFFVPLFLRSLGGEFKARKVDWAIQYLAATWPYYNRSNGSNHLFVTNEDWGNCEVGDRGYAYPPLMKGITISLWAFTKNMGNKEGTPEKPACFRDGIDVALPPSMWQVDLAGVPWFQTPGERIAEDRSRTTLLYFKGFRGENSSSQGGWQWSNGVRQAVFDLYLGKDKETGFSLTSTEGLPSGYVAEIKKSVFCLAPCGYGWGNRAVQAVLLGCIPVVIQPDVVMPFDGTLLNWSEFSVRLEKADIAKLPEILRNISADEIKKKRQALERVWMRFVWTSPSWNPFAYLPEEVHSQAALQLSQMDVVTSVIQSLAKKKAVKPTQSGPGLATVAGNKAGRVSEPSAKAAVPAVAAKSSSKCPDACREHGTCNEVVGECFCTGGFKGPTCSQPAFPSCQLAAGGAPNYTPCFLPSSCSCAAECDAFHFKFDPVCYDDKSALSKSSASVYSLPQVIIQVDGAGNEADTSREPVKPGEGHGPRFIGPENCPEFCRGRGVCDARYPDNPTCLCAWSSAGPNCSLAVPADDTIPFLCANNCSNSGVCMEGTCHCSAGSFGIDCSLRLDQQGAVSLVKRAALPWLPEATPAPGEKPFPLIYVYELPPHLNTWQFQHSPRLDFQESALFLERLLASPHRTASPTEAHFFFIPLIVRNRDLQKMPVLDEALQYIRTRYPEQWGRANGADHLLVTNDPWGNCEFASWGRMDHVVKSLTTITMWGVTRDMDGNRKKACFRYGRDILVPPRLSGEVFLQSPMLAEELESEAGRARLLYFGGDIGSSLSHSGYSHSFGVRKKMLQLYGGRENSTGILVEPSPAALESKWKRMRESAYCLVTSAWGWDTDLSAAVLMGCVPVIVMPNTLQPYEGDLLDYSGISLRLQLNHLPVLERILRNVSSQDLREGRQRLREEWYRFVWTSPSLNPLAKLSLEVQDKVGASLARRDVFSSVMDILGMRARNATLGKKGNKLALPFGVDVKTASELADRTGGVPEDPTEEDSPSRASKCADECFENGSCNEELGRCDCLTNKAGESCSHWAMPACHVSAPTHPQYFTPCHLPNPCACTAQCAGYLFGSQPAYVPMHDMMCFDERRGNGTVETDAARLFDGPQAIISLDEDWKEVRRERTIDSGVNATKRWVAPELCPDMCNYRGTCEKNGNSYYCVCGALHNGVDCDGTVHKVVVNCFNHCSQRGECVEGMCKCRRGFFGIDCSLYLDANGKAKLKRRSPFAWAKSVEAPAKDAKPLRPSIYVYELPQYLNSWQAMHAIPMDWPEQQIFIERVLASPHRTADPDDADFFLLPLVLRNRVAMKLAAAVAALKWVQATYPRQWARRHGRDHFLIANDDWGQCELEEYGFGTPQLSNVTVLSLWGHTRNSRLGPEKPCFRPGKDIVIPPVMERAVYKYAACLRQGPAPNRTIFAYFRGFSGEGSFPFGDFTWSFGVRQKLFEVYAGRENATGVLLQGTQMYAAVWNFLEHMERSVYCLAPAGWGWGMRATQAVIVGCVPVIIQPRVLQAFEGDLLDWEDFSVVLRYQDIPSLHTILRSIPPDVLEAKRAAGRRVWTRFVWASRSANPFAGLPEDVREKWAPVLEKADVLASVLEIFRRRLDGSGDSSTWMGGAPQDKVRGVPYGGREGYKSKVLQEFEGSRQSPAHPAPQSVGRKLAVALQPAAGSAVAAPAAASRCKRGCSGNGTCNEELGECQCLGNYAGPSCGELAMPACHLAPNYYTPCLHMTSCACLIQCNKHHFQTPMVCYDERRGNGSVETDLARLFAGPQAGVWIHADGTEKEPRERVEEKHMDRQFTAPHHCANNCSGRGVCHNASRTCLCGWIHEHGDCSSVDQSLSCFSNCSGKGACVDGTCLCEAGFFGMDCSLFLGAGGKPQLLSRPAVSWAPSAPPATRPRPLVYVYELPGHLNSWQFLHSGRLDWMEPILFLERLLSSPHRTANGEEADFFYIPLILRTRMGHRMQTLRAALQYVQQRWPFFQRSAGRDHVVLTNDDWGNCEIGPYGLGEPLLDSLVTLTLWGNTRNMELNHSQPCFRAGKDIVIPPAMFQDVYHFAPAVLEAENQTAPPRTTLLYFKGWPAMEAQFVGKYRWSFGVRQEMFRLYAGREKETGIRLVATEGGVSGYLEEMQRSVFCLAPSGHGFGMRATQAAIVGCIPVVIQPDVVQPLEGDLLNWEEFSVVLEKKDIPRIAEILRAIPEASVKQKQKKCREVWTRFTWTTPSSVPLGGHQKAVQALGKDLLERDAFASIMAALAKRLEGKQQVGAARSL